MGSYCIVDVELQPCTIKRVPEMDGCPAMNMCLTPLNWTQKRFSNFYVTCILQKKNCNHNKLFDDNNMRTTKKYNVMKTK